MAIVEVELVEGVGRVTLNDPGSRNAFTLDSIAALVQAVDDLEATPECRALVVTGAPPAFCGGANLDTLTQAVTREPATDDAGATDHGDGLGRPAPASGRDEPASGRDEAATSRAMRAIYAGFLRVAQASLPTVAAVNGAAVGAGMNLALACDLRLVAASGYFESRFARLGLHPGGGHTWLLRNLVGPEHAAALVLFDERVSSDEAVRIGLAHRRVPDDRLVEEATALAARAARAPRALTERMKATLNGMAAVASLEDAVAIELDAQVWSLYQPGFADAIAGLRAGIAARQPGRVGP